MDGYLGAMSSVGRRGVVVALLLVAASGGFPPARAAAAPTCAGAARLVVYADNLSPDPDVTLTLEGDLRDPGATCDGIAAASYATTLHCHGAGVVPCGAVDDLQPGAWVHRLSTTVTDSAPQLQARQSVLLGAATGAASNVIVWTVYPSTFVVGGAAEADLRGALDAAASFTRDHDGSPALVTFDRTVFPGAGAPSTIELTSGLCAADGRHAALCIDASHLVVDALDARGDRGGVVLSVATTAAPLLRLYGADDLFRGLVFEGSRVADLAVQADTVAIVGAAARRNRFEQCLVRGPTKGDAVSVQSGAGQSLDGGDASNTIDDCELTGARDRGLKITTGGRATLEASCLHDNRNGGAQVTLGGALTAIDNLIQHNVPGSSQSGLAGGAAGDGGARNTLVSRGDIVRFSGARGISVTDAADATFRDDYVADNQFTGARVESTIPGNAPSAAFRGVALVCNHNGGITGTCRSAASDDGALCTTDADCCGTGSGCCAGDPDCAMPVRCVPPAPQGFGAVLAACDGCPAPSGDFGTDADPGANALTLNVNVYPNALGANLLQGVPGLALDASGNQWEHCGTTASCDTGSVAVADVQLASGASVDVGAPPGPRYGAPVALTVSPARPRAGDLVRVFGSGFNAVDGAACAQATTPVAACSSGNPRVAQANRASRYGNRVLLTMAGQTFPVDLDAVTPTMLAFRMPFDCFAPAGAQVSRRNVDGIVQRSNTIAFCDPGGCLDRPAGAPCDDGNRCTVGDTCDGAGRCVPGPAPPCGGACMQCDATRGCVPRSSTAPCDDGNACTSGDHCRGDADLCVPGPPIPCAGACLTGTCDPEAGCVPRSSDAACDDGNACTTGDHCRGDADVCVSAGQVACTGQCLTGSCDPQGGCVPRRRGSACEDGSLCTTDDRCTGDGDVCVSGPPVACDDHDPCAVASCDATLGCRHDPVGGFDAVLCRFVRSGTAIDEGVGAASAPGRVLDRFFVAITKATEAARATQTAGNLRKLARELERIRKRLLTLEKSLARRHLPSALVDLLRTNLDEAVAALDRLRAP